MKKFTGIRIAGLIILITIILYMGYKTYNTAYRLGTVAGKMIVINDIPKEYMNLFKNNANITYKDTHFDDNKNRNPVSDFIFDAKYAVFVTKIKTATTSNSLPLITIKFKKTETTNDIVYSRVTSGHSQLDYFLDTLSTKNISLTFYGDSIRSIVKNDTIEGYYLKNKNFSINYKTDGVVNMFMRTTESELPTVLFFLVQQQTLYFICISVRHSNYKFNMNIVNKLIDIPPSSARCAVNYEPKYKGK